MSTTACQVRDLADRQHEAVAAWQLRALGSSPGQIKAAVRGLLWVYRGVYARDDLTETGWYMASALAMGPTGAVSHRSGLMLVGLRPYEPGDIHVSFTGGGRSARPGLIPHRRTRMEVGTFDGVPVTSPSQCLRDADLERQELYRALEEAGRRRLHVRVSGPVADLQRRVSGRTRSDAEARFILLCHDHRFPLPLVNHRLNGVETDFHWPRERLVVEVDGWAFHSERAQFEEDRRRSLAHQAAGWTVIRASAEQVRRSPALVARAIRQTTGW